MLSGYICIIIFHVFVTSRRGKLEVGNYGIMIADIVIKSVQSIYARLEPPLPVQIPPIPLLRGFERDGFRQDGPLGLQMIPPEDDVVEMLVFPHRKS